jgi:hypothetical protein
MADENWKVGRFRGKEKRKKIRHEKTAVVTITLPSPPKRTVSRDTRREGSPS